MSLINFFKKTPNIRANISLHKTPFATGKCLFDELSLPGKPESQAPDAIKTVYHERHLIRLYPHKGFYVGAKSPVSDAPKHRLISFCERTSGGREKGHNIL